MMKSKRAFHLIILMGVFGLGSVSCNQSPPSPPSSPSPLSSDTKGEREIPSPTQTLTTNSTPQKLPLPQPNSQGDYQRTNHLYWQAIDSDPKGISCRMGQYSLEQLQNPGSNILLDINNWSVIGTFKPGQTFQIDLGPGGSGVIYDHQKAPWFFVAKSDQKGAPTHCFIRANSNFVKPISSP